MMGAGITRGLMPLFLFAAILLPASAVAQPTLSDATVADVTASGFTVVFESDEPGLPGVIIYSDSAGTIDITDELDVLPYHLGAGDPTLEDEYEVEDSQDDLVAAATDFGLSWIRVSRCMPGTTYYYRVTGETDDGETRLPADGEDPLEVTTAAESPLLAEGRYLLVTITGETDSIDPFGWVATLDHDDAAHGVLGVVGDGAGPTEVFFNLGNFFGDDGLELPDLGVEEFEIQVRTGFDTDDFEADVTVEFDGEFAVAAESTADVPLPFFTDVDEDGMSDILEELFFGNLDRDGTGDFDDDGVTDADELAMGGDPTRNDLPAIPRIVEPESGEVVVAASPAALLFNRVDEDGTLEREFTYQVELFVSSDLTSAVSSVLVDSEGDDFTSSDLTLDEDESYTLRARQRDTISASEWAYRKFRRSEDNDAPGDFNTSFPRDGDTADTLTPVLEVTNAVDPEGDALSYSFEVYSDDTLTTLVTSSDPVIQDDDGTTEWTVDTDLTDATDYWWVAIAADDTLSVATLTASFSVDLSNAHPPDPVLDSPADGSVVDTASVDLTVTNAVDPDADTVSYFFELDRVPTFDSAALQTSGAISEDVDTTTWMVTPGDEGTYYWRWLASDGSGTSRWSMASFTLDAVDDLPAPPIPHNPSDGAWVDSLTPRLEVMPGASLDGLADVYNWEVYADEALTDLVTSGASAGPLFVVDVELTDTTWYWWRANQEDPDGDTSDWTAEQAFQTNLLLQFPPFANAASDGSVITGVEATLDGTGSAHPGGESLDFLWQLRIAPGGSTLDDGSILDAGTSLAGLAPDVDGEYGLRLIVTDRTLRDLARTSFDAATDDVPPNADAGADQFALTGTTVTVDASASNDPDDGPDPLTFLWEFLTIPADSALVDADISDSDTDLASFEPDVAGLYILQVTVDDGLASDVDEVLIMARDTSVPPNANAGADLFTEVDGETFLDGSASFDPDALPDPLAFSWRFLDLPDTSVLTDGDISDAGTSTPAFTPDVGGTYLLELNVDDGEFMDTDNVAVIAVSELCAPVGDLLCVSETAGATSLTWTLDDEYESIVVLRDGEEVATLAGDAESFGETGLPAGDYTYTVEATCLSLTEVAECEVTIDSAEFVRGDCNGDGRHDISDAIFDLIGMLLGTVDRLCLDACDANDDGLSTIGDPIYSLAARFEDGPAIPDPNPDCGGDPTDDDELGCDTHIPCEGEDP